MTEAEKAKVWAIANRLLLGERMDLVIYDAQGHEIRRAPFRMTPAGLTGFIPRFSEGKVTTVSRWAVLDAKGAMVMEARGLWHVREGEFKVEIPAKLKGGA